MNNYNNDNYNNFNYNSYNYNQSYDNHYGYTFCDCSAGGLSYDQGESEEGRAHPIGFSR